MEPPSIFVEIGLVYAATVPLEKIDKALDKTKVTLTGVTAEAKKPVILTGTSSFERIPRIRIPYSLRGLSSRVPVAGYCRQYRRMSSVITYQRTKVGHETPLFLKRAPPLSKYAQNGFFLFSTAPENLNIFSKNGI